MLSGYIQAAMRRAKYEILPDDGSIYGEIPPLRGVWANENSLDECQRELESVLGDWILYCTERHIKLPVIDRINLNSRKFNHLKQQKVA